LYFAKENERRQKMIKENLIGERGKEIIILNLTERRTNRKERYRKA
jgi:hypothetical protein